MTRQRLKLTNQEYRATLSRLQEVGVVIGAAVDPSPEPERLIVEQTSPCAKLFELPLSIVAVAVPARITVLASQILITEFEMTTGWDDSSLFLEDPEENYLYENVMNWLPFPRPVLNRRLTGEIPLRRGQMEGTILAYGPSTVHPQWPDNRRLKVKLFLMDERGNEIIREFGVALDHFFKDERERTLARQHESIPLNRRGGGRLYAPEAGPTGDPKSVVPERGIKPQRANRNDDAKPQKPN